MESLDLNETITKLKLSHLDLPDPLCTSHLTNMVSLNQPGLSMHPLKELDISSTGLSTKDLSFLLERLNENQDRLRYLNIGYNPIVDDQE